MFGYSLVVEPARRFASFLMFILYPMGSILAHRHGSFFYLSAAKKEA
jgi:hypothetical protein